MDNFIANSVNKLEAMLKEAYDLGLSEGNKGKFDKKISKTSRRNC